MRGEREEGRGEERGEERGGAEEERRVGVLISYGSS